MDLTAVQSNWMTVGIIRRMSTFTTTTLKETPASLNQAGRLTTILVQKVYNLRIAFNVSYDGQSFVYMHAPCINTTFDNNTVIRTEGFGSNMYDIVYTAFDGITFRNNLYVGTKRCFQGGPYKKKERVISKNCWFWQVDGTKSDGNPLLVDIKDKDFRLRTDSPLRGKGLNLRQHYETDFAGNPLPKTGPWDIGAIHFSKKEKQ